MAQNKRISIDAYHCLRDKYDLACLRNAKLEHELHHLRNQAMLKEHEILNKLERLSLRKRLIFLFRKDSIYDSL